MFTTSESQNPIDQIAAAAVAQVVEAAAPTAATPSELAGRAIAAGEAMAMGIRAFYEEIVRARHGEPPKYPAPGGPATTPDADGWSNKRGPAGDFEPVSR